MKEILDNFRRIQEAGIDIIEAIFLAKKTPEELARNLRMTIKEIERMRWLYMQFSHVLHRKMARSKQLSIKQLEIVATGVNKCSNPAVNKLELRAEFIEKSAILSPGELKDYVATRLRTLNRGYVKRRKSTVGCSKNPDQDGMGHVHAKLPFHMVRAIQIAVHHRARRIRKHNKNLAYDQALAQAFEQMFTGEKTGEHIPWQPVFLYALNGGEHIQADGTVATSAGCVVKLADILNQELAPYGYVVTYALDDGGIPQPIATWRVESATTTVDESGRDPRRHASWRQRFNAIVEHPVCAHPDCTRPAETCDMHHIVAWGRGGRTDFSNLAPLCRVHNARNDDEPGKHKNGRVERCSRTGRIGFRPHPNVPLAFHRSEVVAKSARSWAVDAFGIDA